ncbi:hypothetical protein Taro_037549 [Colocasia esculenta]|uniref:Uncharacterized protein n=1 Tax=Colocasia esculenta TaxID=4460 RepID=A0A843WA30_COLES|nr:hypothetical protein [Colocasia esculenta]
MLTSTASRPTNDFVGLVSSSKDVDYVDANTSRPTNDFVGLVSYSGDVVYVDAISFKTYGKLCRSGFIIWLQDLREPSLAWLHIQVMSIVSTPSASRPTGNSIGLVSSSGDVTSFMLTPSASRPTGNSVGLVSSSGDVDYVDVDSLKTHE